MNHKLITDHSEYYLLLDLDAEINREDDCYYYNGEVHHKNKGISINGNTDISQSKIIGYYPKKDAPKLEGVPLMVELNEEDDVKKLANNLTEIYHKESPSYPKRNHDELSGYWHGVVSGYKAAQSENKYSELIDELELLINDENLGESYRAGIVASVWRIKELLSSSKEKEVIDYEVEMERVEPRINNANGEFDEDDVKYEPKILNGIIYGKWITK